MSDKLVAFNFNSENISDLVIITSSAPISLPPGADDKMRADEKDILVNLAQYNKVNLTIPADGNIYKPNYSNAYTHSPQTRAAMIYEAITAKKEDGSYKNHNIFLTGGHNGEDVIFELEKLVKEKGGLPQRAEDLKTYGFSDATQLHQYLGQRGISTPVAYSKNIKALIGELSQPSLQSMQLKPLNDVAKNPTGGEFKGVTMPAAFRQIENRSTHQAKLFSDTMNMVYQELRGSTPQMIEQSAIDFYQSLQHPAIKGKSLCILLSQDSHPEAIAKFQELSGEQFPVFIGATCGHGEAMKNGRAFNLFSNCKIDSQGVMNWEKSAVSTRSAALMEQDFIEPPQIAGGQQTLVENVELRGSSAHIPNLEQIQKEASELTIKLSGDCERSDNDICQLIDMALKELRERGMINPEKLKTLKIEGTEINNPTVLKDWMHDQQKLYYSKTNIIYNGMEIPPPEKNKTAQQILQFRGLKGNSELKPIRSVTLNKNLRGKLSSDLSK